MSSIVRPTQARAAHLAAVTQLYGSTQPSVAAYWGSEWNDLRADSEAHSKAINLDLCQACGCLSIPSKSSVTGSTSGDLPEVHRTSALSNGDQDTGSAKKRTRLGSQPQMIGATTTCLHCGRYSKRSLQPKKTNVAKELSHEQSTKDSSRAAQVESAAKGTLAITTDSSGVGKAKRKQKKGGLAAMLARSKGTTSSSATPKALGFSDLARKT